MRKLNFLWKILQKDNDNPVKQIYVELKRNCFEKNWANKVMELRSRYGPPICDEEVECTSKTEWCKKVMHASYRFALNELNANCKASSKSNMLPFLVIWSVKSILLVYTLSFPDYSSRQKQESSISNAISKINIEITFGVVSVLLLMRACSICSSDSYIKVYKVKSSHDIYDYDLCKFKKWAKFLKKYAYIRNYMLGDEKKTRSK